ncbi:MAG: glucosyltransferase [Candidatus Tectimicrobiota bacterium]|nr:MAG: glucosyltransferase [Candidatus Tectomicrobia bacterium]
MLFAAAQAGTGTAAFSGRGRIGVGMLGAWALVILHLLVTLALFAYTVNWYVLLALMLRRWRKVIRQQRQGPGLPAARQAWPAVLVQLPVYNEKQVVRRVIQAACALDWPRERLTVQVLDDSTDDTPWLVAAEVARWRTQGVDVQHLRRHVRHGYKAGALQEGQKRSQAPFTAIFDADFVPPRDWLQKTIPYLLADPRVGAVQTRWTHLNRDASLLTRVLALAIDGHFAVEQAARLWNGLLGNFNGTAGVWRAAAIQDAGGWQGDTLTEDLDLSYRAQLRGWRIAYLPEVTVAAELPADMRSVKAQQFRWAKGSLQTARKLLPRLWQAPLPGWVKLQATLHLTVYLIHPLMLASVGLALLQLPLVPAPQPLTAVDLALFAVGVLGPLLSYGAAQLVLYRDGWRRLWLLPLLLPLGAGLAMNTTRAFWQVLRRRPGEFVRTPKRGAARSLGEYRLPLSWPVLLDGLGGAGCAVAAWLYATRGHLAMAGLLGLYALGFIAVALLTLCGDGRRG